MSQEQHLHHAVVARLRTVATLIGKPQSEPLEVDGQQVVPGLGLLNPAIHLNSRADRLERGELRITAAGAVSRGKSTLLNACFGKDMLPTGLEAVTGGICQVVYGGNFDEVTLIEKGASRTMPYADFCEFISLATDEQPPLDSVDPFPLPARLESLDYAVLQSDAPLCEKGIQFVDTLGFNAGPKQELITQRFLEATDALLIVLRTAPLVDANDVALINSHYYSGGEGVGNMFFAINDFGVSDEERRVLMEETAPTRMRNFFLNAAGEFDQELFDRRVFLVNAKEALDAQIAGAGDDALEQTGISTLERALEHALIDGELRQIAMDAALARTLLPALAETRLSMQHQKHLMSRDIAELLPALHDAAHQVNELTQKVNDVQTTIERFGRQIARKAAAHFDTFTAHFVTPPGLFAKPPWHADWDSLEFDSLLSLKNVGHAALFTQKREELAEEMTTRLERYIGDRTQAWGNELLTHLQPDINAMIAETEAEVEEFTIQLAEIQQHVAGQQLSDEFVDMDKQRGLKVLQMVIGGWRLDPNQIIGPMLDAGWGAFIVRLVADSIAIYLAAILGLSIGGPAGWLTFFGVLATETILVYKGDRAFMMNRVRNKIGKQFAQLFSVQGPGIKAEIQTNLERQFTRFASQLQGTLGNELAAAKLNWDAAAEARREGQAAVDKETTRLETIDSLLTAQFEAVSTAVHGRVLTSEEQKALVERFTFSEDEDSA